MSTPTVVQSQTRTNTFANNEICSNPMPTVLESVIGSDATPPVAAETLEMVETEIPASSSCEGLIISDVTDSMPALIRPDPDAVELLESVQDCTDSQISTARPQNENEEMHIPEDPFAEYFSTFDDGSVKIPPWLIAYLGNERSADVKKEEQEPTGIESDLSDENDVRNATPFLPFDKIIGYEYPQEAELALSLLFEGRQEPGPLYDCTKYVLCEIVVGSKVYLGLGE